MKTYALKKRTYKMFKALFNRLMPMGSNRTVNLIEIPRLSVEHKFKMKQKPQSKPKHWVNVEQSKTTLN